MSFPEASTESNKTHVEELDEHGEKHDPEVTATDISGELNDVEGNVQEQSEPGHIEEHQMDGDGEGDESGEEETEGDEDEDEEDASDDDEEPALKYERIGGSLSDLLKKDSASALAIVNKIMVWLFYSLFLYNVTLLSPTGTRDPRWHRTHSGSQRQSNQII